MRATVTATLVAIAIFIQPAIPAGAQPGTAGTADPVSASETLCNAAEARITTSSPTLVEIHSQQGQRKSWQPLGGEIGFALQMGRPIPPDAQVLVCFRWSPADERTAQYRATRPDRLDLTPNGKTLEVFATIPRGLRDDWPGSAAVRHTGIDLVPLADVRILVVTPDAAGPPVILADVRTALGVASALWGAGLALGTLILGVALLALASRRRRSRGVARPGPLLGIIATQDGHASLARLQLVLWTLLLATSAVYVMVLSGELIQVTEGTLALLGISGAVTVGAEANRKLRDALSPASRVPRWSDLVLNEGPVQNSIDIARMQILYFTLIAVAFVALRVATSFVIPDIPAGFQVLLGLSSAVYLGSKVAWRS